MSEASQVTVRLLPDQVAWRATVRERRGVEIEVSAPPEDLGLSSNALVEIESADTLSLGKVVSREETRVVVAVEHIVDLHKLARIQEVWHASKV